jgi:hypothetical protein
LPYSANDAVSVSRLFEKSGYEVILRADTAATLYQLERDFATIARMVDYNDLFVFYFSGHGLSAETFVDMDKTVADDYFSMLLYHDFVYGNVEQYIDENAVDHTKISQLFGTLPPCLKAGVIDACYSGALIDRQSVVDYVPNDYDGKPIDDKTFASIAADARKTYTSLRNQGNGIGYTMIASSGSKEVSWDGFFSHSVFTYFFLMSAEQGDLNKDGVITSLESYSYVFAACQKYWNTPAQDSVWNFLPHITGGAEDIILFSRPLLINEGILNSQ